MKSVSSRSSLAVAENLQRGNKHCFRGWMRLQRDWGIFPENNGCLECLAPLTARTVPYRKRLMCREEVRAATISSTASCREEWRMGWREVQMIKELRVETWMWIALVLISRFWSSSKGHQNKKGFQLLFQSMMPQLWSRVPSITFQIISIFQTIHTSISCWVQLSPLDLVYIKTCNCLQGQISRRWIWSCKCSNLFIWYVFYEKFCCLCCWIAVGFQSCTLSHNIRKQ